MPGGWRNLLLLVGLAAGCRSPVVAPGCPTHTAERVPPELPAVTAASLEPTAYPSIELASATLPAAPPGWRGLTETQCRCLAASNAAVAKLIGAESGRPTVWVPTHRKACPPDESWKDDLRRHAADEARNRAAAEALDRYLQLADAVARMELLADGLAAFDRLRAEAPDWRAAGLPVPSDAELLLRRAKLLADADQAEAGTRLLDIDLKARLGVSTKEPARLRPVGPFGVTADAVDVEAAVQTALGRRSDLRLLRSLHGTLSADSLPAAREALRAVNPALGDAGPPTGAIARRVAEQVSGMTASAELPVRRQQLFDLIAERERQTAAEVRAAASQLDPLARRAALLRARAESWRAKVEGSTKPAERRPAELEWYSARAEAVAAAFDWHRARVKLLAVQGLLPDGCE